jgi:GAF domain-containing protein
LRVFVTKAAHFIESESLVAAFGAALDRFSNGAGHAIYLASSAGHFERAHCSLANAPALLEVDDDIAVSLRTSHQGVALTEAGAAHHAQLALPMLQGDKLKGIVLLGAKPEAQGYRPDEQAVLEFAAARIGLDLNRLHAAQLAEQLRQIQHERELQFQEQRLLQQELDSVRQERETLVLALSKIGASA